MKKRSFLVAVVFMALAFASTVGYSETKNPIKQQSEIYVQSTNLP